MANANHMHNVFNENKAHRMDQSKTYFDSKYFLALALKVYCDEEDLSVVGSEFQHFGPLAAKVLILVDFCALIINNLQSLLPRVE
jgi:hypothetical protein